MDNILSDYTRSEQPNKICIPPMTYKKGTNRAIYAIHSQWLGQYVLLLYCTVVTTELYRWLFSILDSTLLRLTQKP